MQVKLKNLETHLQNQGFDLCDTQSIILYLKYFGRYEDENLLVVVDAENGEYFVEHKKVQPTVSSRGKVKRL